MAQKMRKNESSAARKRESAHRIEFVCFVKRHQKLLKVAPAGVRRLPSIVPHMIVSALSTRFRGLKAHSFFCPHRS